MANCPSIVYLVKNNMFKHLLIATGSMLRGGELPPRRLFFFELDIFYFMKTPSPLPYIAYLPVFQFSSNPGPSPCSFSALFLWLNVWSRQICVILLNDIMDPNLSSFGILVLVVPCYAFYATRY